MYVEICGYGVLGDVYYVMCVSLDGEGAARAMRVVMRDVGVDDLFDVGYVNVYVMGMFLGDVVEVMVFKIVFGVDVIEFGCVFMMFTKGVIGYLFGVAGVIEVAYIVMVFYIGDVFLMFGYDMVDLNL